jgi:antitoxin component YwqK of YwqJK toxin-antitoxin module
VNKKSEGKFLYGNKIGEWIYYNEYGMKVTVENFQNSKLSIVTNFYNNGVIKSKGKYVKGQREGEWLYWNAYGRLYLRGEFKKDRYVGLWYRYLKNGEIIKLLYSNGVLLNTNLGGAIKND